MPSFFLINSASYTGYNIVYYIIKQTNCFINTSIVVWSIHVYAFVHPIQLHLKIIINCQLTSVENTIAIITNIY